MASLMDFIAYLFLELTARSSNWTV